MKVIKISDENYSALINIKADLMKKQGETVTFDNVIKELLKSCKI